MDTLDETIEKHNNHHISDISSPHSELMTVLYYQNTKGEKKNREYYMNISIPWSHMIFIFHVPQHVLGVACSED